MLGGMSGNNPLMPSLLGAGGSNSDFSSSLLSSLLSSGNNSGGGGNPLGLMGELLSPSSSSAADEEKSGRRHRRGKSKKGAAGGGGMDTLAKSVLSSLLKRIEDEETQETICNYLHSTNTQQIMQFSSMAGIPIKESSAKRLVTMAGGVTPKGISKSISKVKRGISIVKLVRKILKVIDKYKAVIILGVLCYWVRSAMMVETGGYSNKSKRKQAKKLAQNFALSLLIVPPLPTLFQGGGSSSGSSSSSRSLGNLCGGMVKSLSRLYLNGSSDGGSGNASEMGIEDELERLQNQLSLIEAIEERNKAQLDSFVDEEDQWQSLEEDERELLSSKDSVIQKMESLTEQLVMLFMGQKMKNG
ncbi:hypothetical protein ACHAXR_003360 [Thalassiosira sp. AJA248-18]